MAKIITILFIAASVGLLLPAGGVAWAADLIEPTRTLDASGKPEGKLVVFSEPPGQPVSLDDLNLGKTPTSITEVKPGIHHLRVATSATDITIEPGQTMQISLYKGSFIKISKPEEELAQPPATVAPSTAESKPSPVRPEEPRPPALSPIDHYHMFGYN